MIVRREQTYDAEARIYYSHEKNDPENATTLVVDRVHPKSGKPFAK